MLVVVLFALLVWNYHDRRTAPVHLAVLAFESDSAGALLADSIATAVRHRLMAVPGFTVVPAARSAGYALSRDSAHAIARSLGVRFLLAGRVSRTGPDVIDINSRLIDTKDSPPSRSEHLTTSPSELCAAEATLAETVAGHFARAPIGQEWGPGGTSGCAEPHHLTEWADPD